MLRPALLLIVLVSIAHADPDRRRVDAAMATAVTDLRDCGRHPRGVFDWASYEAIDWIKLGKDRGEYLASVRSTLTSLGAGVNQLCADADYKAVLGTIETIVYKVTDDRATRLQAVVTGTTLTFTDYTFGSTRDIDDFAAAAKAACDDASVGRAPARIARAPAPRAGTRAWDGTYPSQLEVTMGSLCPRTELTGALKVSGGRFSFPWYVDDWNTTGALRAKPVKVGRVDGVVDASGAATSTAVFAEPVLASTQVRTVKVKRRLDAISGVAIAFARQGADRVVTLRVDVEGDRQCKAAWAIVKRSPPPRVAGGRRRADPPADAPHRDPPADARHPSTPARAEPDEAKDPCEGLPNYKENGTYHAGDVVRADTYYASQWRRYTCRDPGNDATCASDFREPVVGRGWVEGPLCKDPGRKYD